MIARAVAENQLFFAVATTMNHEICISAMSWFREQITFSRDFTDIPLQLIAHAEDKNMLSSIKDYAKKADIGIVDMDFEINSTILEKDALPDDMPEDMKASLSTFMQALSKSQELQLQQSQVKVTAYHQGRDEEGNIKDYPLDLSLESDGTLRLMALGPIIEKTRPPLLTVPQKEAVLRQLGDYLKDHKKGDKNAQVPLLPHTQTACINGAWTLEQLSQDMDTTKDRDEKLFRSDRTFTTVHEAVLYLESLPSVK